MAQYLEAAVFFSKDLKQSPSAAEKDQTVSRGLRCSEGLPVIEGIAIWGHLTEVNSSFQKA